jgi:hypothetical protein
MGLFDFLKPAPFPAYAHDEVNRLTDELLRIGKQDDFLSEHPGGNFNMQCRHIRAREIGKRLSELGGVKLMWWAYDIVRSKNKKNRALADHLEYCWVDVGDWKV